LRRELIEQTTRLVDRRVPVLVGITDTSLAESIRLAGTAADAGCDAVVVAPTYYFPLQQRDLVTYVRQMIAELPLPLVLYNMPALTSASFAPESVAELLHEEAIVALKDSSGDLDYFRAVREVTRIRPDFTLLVGPEHLLAETLALGGDGGVTGGANIWPEPFVELYNAAFAREEETVARCSQCIARLGEVYRVGEFSIPAIIAHTKTAASLRGICSDPPAPPIAPSTPEEREQINRILATLNLLKPAQAKCTNVQ
jgi:4-hydroxy-tetrahydrodipicolinate synthase